MNFKKITSLLLAVLMVVSVFPLALISVSAAATAPTALPDGKTFETASFTAKTDFAIPTTQKFDEWKPPFGSNFEDYILQADGLMFKFDVKEIANDKNGNPLPVFFTFEMNISGNGKNAYLCANVRRAAAHNTKAQIVADGTTSTIYYTMDGTNWTTIEETMNAATQDSQGMIKLSDSVGTGYVFIPFASMCFNKDNNGDGKADSFSEIVAIYGEDFTFNNFCMRASGDTAYKNTVFSEFKFVFTNGVPTIGPDGVDKAPTKLPNNEPYTSSFFYKDSFDLMTLYRAYLEKCASTGAAVNGTGWPSIQWQDTAAQAVKDGAEGIMFRLDTSKATCQDDIFNFTFAIQIMFTNVNGEKKDTYIVSTPNQAAGYGPGKYAEGMKSTWYYAKDGENWKELVTEKTSYAAIPAGKGYTYVFIPMNAFWAKHGESYFKTGTHTDGDLVLNWDNLKSLLPSDWSFAGCNYFFSGSLTSPQLEQDSTVTISGWKVLTAGAPAEDDPTQIPTDPSKTSPTAPTTLPGGEAYKKSTFLKDSFDLVAVYQAYYKKTEEAAAADSSKNPDYSQSQWQGGTIMAEDATAVVKDGAAGIMFKIDSSAATTAKEFLNMTFALQILFGTPKADGSYPYNTYLLATAAFAPNYSEAKKVDGASSTWYYSYNGKDWNELVITEQRAPVPVGRGYTHVFIPMEAFWAKCGESYLTTGVHDKTQPITPWSTVKTIIGNNWKFAMSNFFFDGKADHSSLAQDPALKITNWRLVTPGEAGGSGATSETPPATLPDGETYVGTTFLKNTFDVMAKYRAYGDAKGDYSQAGWPGGAKNDQGANAVPWIKDGAQGIMFRIDTTKTTSDYDTMKMVFAMQISFAGGNRSTYVLATPKHATAFSEAKMAEGATSKWYYSQNGESWTEFVATADTGSYVTIPAGRGYTYVFVPMDAFWTKCGETFLKTGSHAKDAEGKVTETIVHWNDALQYFGSDWTIGLQNYYFDGNKTKTALAQDPETRIDNWKIVKHGVPTDVPEGGAAHAPENLPNGEQYKLIALDPNFSIKGDTIPATTETPSAPWNGAWYASDKNVVNKINFKETGGEIQNAMGFMFKFDTSKSKLLNATDALKMGVELAIGSPGKSTYFLADPYYVTAYGGKLNVNAASSIWYFSIDGYTWEAVEKTKAGNGVSVTSECTVGYIYIPLDQFWTKGYAAGDEGKRATEALAEMGAEAKIHDMKIRLGSAGVSCDPNTLFSEFSIVKSAYCMNRETVSITDTLDWNIYVAAPSTYTSPNMTFKMGKQTVEAKATKLADGSLKYTFAGISAKDISTPVTATWTAKDDKNMPYTETYTTTMEEYLRSVLANPAYTNYTGLVQSLLHYAAALQTAAGQTGDLANKDVPALEASDVDLDRLKFVNYENNFKNMWGAPKLDLKNGTTTVKVPVTPPSKEYTKVRYETENGRIGSVDIQNGYAYIPVYAHEMRLTIKLDFYKSGSTSDAGSMTFSLNYLIAECYAANKADPAVVQALANYCNEARKFKY